LQLVREGLEAWRRGDFAAVEAMFDPAATWHATEPGEWDCRNRNDVMQILRQRYEEGFARGEVKILDARSDAVIILSHPNQIAGDEWPDEVATVFTFEGERIVAMKDFRTREEALAATERGR
jgi:ketosteroid isomerase-like protein